MADEIVAVYRAEVEQYKKAVDELVGKVAALEKEQEQVKKSGKEAFSAIAGEAGKISPEFNRARSTMSAFRGSIGTVINSMKTLRGAVIATGIGALVVTITALVSWFTKTERGAQFLRTAMAGLGAMVNTVRDALIGLVDAGAALLQGDVRGAAEIAAKAFSNMGGRIVDNAKAAIELEKAMNRVKVQTRNLTVETAKSRAEIKAFNLIAEDTTKSYEERRDAARKAFNIENSLMQRRVALAEENLRIIREQNNLAENAEKDFEAEAQAEVELNQIREQSLELQTTLNNKLNIIEQQIAANRAKAAEDQKKSDEEAKARREKELQQSEEILKARAQIEVEAAGRRADVERALAAVRLEIDEQLNRASEDVLRRQIASAMAAAEQRQMIADESLANGIISEREYEQITSEIDATAKSEREDAEKAHQDRINEIKKAAREKDEEERAAQQRHEIEQFNTYAGAVLNIIGGISNAVASASQYELQILQSQLDRQTISQEQYDRRRRQILRDQAENAKAFAIMQAVIQTAMGVTQALGSAPPPASFILAAITGALGAIQIGVIAAEPIPQFATGVIGLQGAGTETSDSIMARLSKGESVMTAAETKKYRPLLEGMRKGTLDEIIQKNYVRPAIDEALLSGFADMGKSAAFQSAFNDMNLLRAIDRHRETEVSELRMMNALLSKYVRTPKRGYA